ncbi:hypothetical protein H0H81_012717 [Sphagnurus paluster]|uniref:Uncharacterized protein n=1 Tax=Sphagnurus paluster TaxID=117069 RepID=A0A9P7FQ91_9AGAR|nr:hypothetical protein H0H81_012717 [Sphagnurus paluster]
MPDNASIGEPFVLSTYGTSQKLPRASVTISKKREPASVFATYGKASGSSDGYATVTAQADGVHILDISTLHPVISHTLGPATTFSCPAVTCNTKQGVESICTTYAAIDNSADISADEIGRTIWMWRENLSSRLEERTSQKKKSVVILTLIAAQDGTWHSHLLESKDGSFLELAMLSEPFSLTGLSFLTKSKSSEEVSLLALSSSHVLLTALTASPTPEIVLLLWDLQYSILLASHALPVPSTLEASDIMIKLTLVPASDSQALLLLSPHTSDSVRQDQTKTSRSSVLVVPLVCPPTSTIANAMGKASAGAKWIAQASSLALPPTHDATSRKLLETMATAMGKNLPQAANLAFFEWEKRESMGSAKSSVGESPNKSKPPSMPANAPYSSEVVRYLIGHQVVNSNMIEGGLLAALRYRNDWQSIDLALTKVIDLTEAEIIESLQAVVVGQRLSAPQDDSAMQIDSVTDLPPLATFLNSCVAYTTTPAALRFAMRHFLREDENVLAVLVVLEGWLNQWSKREIKLLPSKKDVLKNEHGVLVLKQKDKEVNRDLPPLPQVLAFLQALLDASFLTLLQYPPAHAVLRNLHALIEPQITQIDELELLRGPLENFAKAHSKAVKEAGQDKRKKVVTDWRQRKKQAHEQAGLSIGLYQVEELIL